MHSCENEGSETCLQDSLKWELLVQNCLVGAESALHSLYVVTIVIYSLEDVSL